MYSVVLFKVKNIFCEYSTFVVISFVLCDDTNLANELPKNVTIVSHFLVVRFLHVQYQKNPTHI